MSNEKRGNSDFADVFLHGLAGIAYASITSRWWSPQLIGYSRSGLRRGLPIC